MKVISKTAVKVQLEKSFKAYSNCHATITNYKQDRQIDIIKNQTDFVYSENGFERIRKKNLNKAKVINLVQKQIAVEFPNSKKIYYIIK